MYRVRQTCMKMLVKRGYNVLQEHVSMSSEAFVEEFGAEPKRNDLTLFVEKARGGGEGGGEMLDHVCSRHEWVTVSACDNASYSRGVLSFAVRRIAGPACTLLLS